ncbi:MAG TPA: PIG-L family deacetylase [Thermoanaerobaculia bacterium]|nr:PIG-L family deacetylase [Thermoanaerobaculia bacterium]
METDERDEASLIPYQASEIADSRILVLAAHPDDETLGAGGTIAINGAAEAIRIWIATDGSRQEAVSPGEAEAYALIRREEARAAARALRVPEPEFGGLPDRGLAGMSKELDESLARLIEEFRPGLILCPSPVEAHPDHRALADALYTQVAASRPGDAEHDLYRLLRIAFYEISLPLLPNTLVDVARVAAQKAEAIAAYPSQLKVRDYAGAIAGLNAYRRLTLDGSGPVEAFRVVSFSEISTISLEAFRRLIGPSMFTEGSRGEVPVSVVVRTRNRPALLLEALGSLRAQTARPRQVVVVNDGGGSVSESLAPFRDAFDLRVEELAARRGRSAAANRGVELAGEELLGFLDDDDLLAPDHLDRLVSAYRQGPEPVVYSDAVTSVFAVGPNGSWVESHRGLQYSLDFDPDYLLLANFIPLHTLLFPRALFLKAGGFDVELEYSEDWDFLIRLSFETRFRHVRAVTCEYRVFESAREDAGKEPAGGGEFQAARRRIYERYASRRTEEGIARVFDSMRRQVAFWYERDFRSQGELTYQRESHRRLHSDAETTRETAREMRSRIADLDTERARLLAENELVHARLADLFAVNERYDTELGKTYAEIERRGALLDQIYRSKTWKLHLVLERLRGRR